MSLIQNLYNIFLEAIFPLSPTERELFSYSPEEAYLKLPRSDSTPLSDTDSVFAYKDDRVKKLIWNIKYKKSVQAIQIGGYALYRGLASEVRPPRLGLTILIPMPITSQRRRERGFNQCELLVNEICRLDTDKRFEIGTDLLVRTHHTSRQTLKDRSERLKDTKNIFSVGRGTTSPNTPIIIVDDVITTGSTMREALETLRKSGFTNIRGISLAH